MPMQVFEYLVFRNEKRDKGKVVTPAEILVEPTIVIAENDRQVGIRAAKAIPDEEMDNLDLIEVKIRPF